MSLLWLYIIVKRYFHKMNSIKWNMKDVEQLDSISSGGKRSPSNLGPIMKIRFFFFDNYKDCIRILRCFVVIICPNKLGSPWSKNKRTSTINFPNMLVLLLPYSSPKPSRYTINRAPPPPAVYNMRVSILLWKPTFLRNQRFTAWLNIIFTETSLRDDLFLFSPFSLIYDPQDFFRVAHQPIKFKNPGWHIGLLLVICDIVLPIITFWIATIVDGGPDLSNRPNSFTHIGYSLILL